MINESLVVGCLFREEGVDPLWHASMMRLARETKCRFIEIPSGPAVDKGRNLVVEVFLQTDSDYLLMVDTRHMFSLDDVERLWNQRSPDRIIGGLCRARDGSWASRMQSPEGGWYPIDDTNEVVEVEITGGAFLLIGREVLEKVKAQGFYRPWFAFTDHYGEDGEFCRRARELGYKVLVNGSVRPIRRQVVSLG